MMTVFFAVVYALGSMVLGSMLLLTHLTPPYYAEVLWSGGAPAWNYPGLLIVQPWGVVTLPFFATIAMVLVSIGVGIGMSVAVLLGIALVRNRRARAGQPAAVGSVAGLTPAMIALVTLGACCSTTAAATAGVGLVGQVSGTSTDNLLLNNWFLGVFQIAVVWIALLAQELLLRVYGGLFGLAAISGAPEPLRIVPPRTDRVAVLGGLLRVGLLVGGVTWSLAMLAEWTTTGPSNASAIVWFSWVVQHQLLAVMAILAALFPRWLTVVFARGAHPVSAAALRGSLLVAGLSLAIGVPPPLSDSGAAGLGNQVWALIAGSGAWGASGPASGLGPGLYFTWTVQFLLLGGFAIALAISPGKALSPLLRSTAEVLPARKGRQGASAGLTPAPTPLAERTAPASAAVRSDSSGSGAAPTDS